MGNKAMNRWRSSLANWLRLGWAVPGLLGLLWFLLDAESGGYILPATALASLAGLALQQSRARAWHHQNVLDAYAEREIARKKKSATSAVDWRSVRRRGYGIESRGGRSRLR